MHLIQSLKNEFCFNLPMFSKYPATSINSYFYKMTIQTILRKTTIHSKWIPYSNLRVIVHFMHGMDNMKHGVADTMRCKHDQGVTSVTGVTDFSIDQSPKK